MVHFSAFFLLAGLSLEVAFSQFTEVPLNKTLVTGGSSIFNCTYPNATAIHWEKEGVRLSSSAERFSIFSSYPNSSSLELENVTMETHNGNYECVADLGGGIEERSPFSVIIAVLGMVTAERVPIPCFDDIFYVRANVSFSCRLPSFSNPPTLTVSWYHVKSSTRSVVRSRVWEVGTSPQGATPPVDIYTNERLRTTDDGAYFCHVDNGVLSQESNRVQIPRVERMVPDNMVAITSGYNNDGQVIPTSTNSQDDSGITFLARKGGATSVVCTFTPYVMPFKGLSWTKNNEGISSGSRNTSLFVDDSTCSSTLFIAHTEAIHKDRYGCFARELISVSIFFNIKIAVIPQFYQVVVTTSSGQPAPSSLGVGLMVMFKCTRSPPNQDCNVAETITWEFQRNHVGSAVPVVTDGSRVVTDDRWLNITSLRVEDTGTYWCVASHNLVTPVRTSTLLQVEEQFPLTITPSVPMALLGTALNLTCSTNSTRPGTLSWRARGNLESTPYTISYNSFPSNSTSSTLTIDNVTESDLGLFSCKIEIPYQLPNYAHFNLTEYDQLYFFGNRSKETVNVMEGTPPLLSCPIRGATPDDVHWAEGAKVFAGGEERDGVEIREGSGRWTLQVLHDATVSQDDGRKYECMVTHSGRELRYSFTLYITQPVKIISSPQPKENATIGRWFSMTCKASGRPLPKILWHPPFDEEDPLVSASMNGTLQFMKVEEKHAGVYHCYTVSMLKGANVDQRQVELMVVSPSSDGLFAGLNHNEATLIFALVGAVTIMIIVACVTLIITICCLSEYRGSYSIAKQMSLDEEDTKGYLNHTSLQGARENPGGVGGKPIYNSFQQPVEGADDEDPSNYFRMQPDGIAMRTFPTEENSFLRDSNNLSSSSLDRGTTLSPAHTLSSFHKPSPPHATLASASMFESEMEEDLANFPRINVELGECLGQGEFGPVMRGVAKFHQAEVEVAVKLLVSETMEEEEEGEEEGGGFRADLAVADYAGQMKLRHVNVVPILGICSDIEPYYIIYEYLDKGDLKHFLRTCRPADDAPPPLSSFQLLHIVSQVAQGMRYLFSQHIIHGDIATRNCMVSMQMDVKIGDLGIGHELYEMDYYDNGSQLLPIRWMPPELLVSSEEGPSFSLHSDVWAFGVFCWEVWSFAQLPYDRYSDEEVLDMVLAGSRLRNPCRSCPPELYLIMMDCWSDQPESRPQFATICTALDQLNSGHSL